MLTFIQYLCDNCDLMMIKLTVLLICMNLVLPANSKRGCMFCVDKKLKRNQIIVESKIIDSDENS